MLDSKFLNEIIRLANVVADETKKNNSNKNTASAVHLSDIKMTEEQEQAYENLVEYLDSLDIDTLYEIEALMITGRDYNDGMTGLELFEYNLKYFKDLSDDKNNVIEYITGKLNFLVEYLQIGIDKLRA